MPTFRHNAHALAPVLSGVALLLLGVGVLSTVLSVRATASGIGSTVLGLIMSAYFVGFIVGTFLAPKVIRRVGHIRTFAIAAAIAACAVLGHALDDHPLTWAGLRAITGVSLVILYAVVESWLATQAHGSERGRIFALYMVVNLLALAAGQFLLVLAPDEPFAVFALVAVLINLSLVPVALTRLEQPQAPASPRLRIGEIARAAPSAAVCAAVSGLAMGAFWGMTPAFAAGIGQDAAGIAWLMAVTILGGAALQWPLGKLSDGGNRRAALRLVAAAAAGVAALVLALSLFWPGVLLPLMFLYGGLAFAIYPIGIAHLSDRVEAARMLEGAAVLLLLHGVGAALGPTLGGIAMALAGPAALFAYFALCWLGLAAFVHLRLQKAADQTPVGAPAEFVPMVRTSAVAMELLAEEVPADPLPADAPPAVRED